MTTTCSGARVPQSCLRFFRKVTSSFFRSLADRESEILVANAVLLMEITSSVRIRFFRERFRRGVTAVELFALTLLVVPLRDEGSMCRQNLAIDPDQEMRRGMQLSGS